MAGRHPPAEPQSAQNDSLPWGEGRRLYYGDPYLTRFTASVVERLRWGELPAVVLDRTALYPTSGGQPHDTGTLNGVPVVDVVEREEDGAVVHVLAAPLEATQVEGQIDWHRRFDLMQQHTGQHILSAAFLERLEANTVSFHLTEEYASIDLDRAPLEASEVAAVEELANAVVFEDRRLGARFVTDEEVPNLPLRKPIAHAGPVRIVEIAGFDCSACGGTHVRATGEVGLIKVTRVERRGAETRVEFFCGRRALADYGRKNDLLLGLAQEFTVGYWELPDALHRQAGELQEARRDLRHAHDALLDAEAAVLWQETAPQGQIHLVQAHFPERGPEELKHLAQRLIAHPRTVALLASGHDPAEKGHLIFARSTDLDLNMGTFMRQACEAIAGRGGGRPEFAQGGAPAGSRVAEALAVARTLTDRAVVGRDV